MADAPLDKARASALLRRSAQRHVTVSPEQRAQIQRRLAAVAEERMPAEPPPKPTLVTPKRKPAVTNSPVVTNSKRAPGRPFEANPSPVALRMRASRARKKAKP